MRRGDDELEPPHLVRLHVDGAVGPDVGLDALEQPEPTAVLPVERVDFRVLLHRARHAHAAGDAQPVRVIRHARARPPALEARVHDRLERLGAIAPDRMHLEIASIPRTRRRPFARQDGFYRRAVQVLPPQVVQARDLLLLARLAHGALDEGGVAVDNHLARDAIRRRSDAGDRLEGVRRDERRDVAIDPQHRFCRALVAPRALAVAGNRRHVVEQTRQLEVDVPHAPGLLIYHSGGSWLVVSGSRMRQTSTALLVALLFAGAAAAQSSPEGVSTDYLDRSVDACTDFYQF